MNPVVCILKGRGIERTHRPNGHNADHHYAHEQHQVLYEVSPSLGSAFRHLSQSQNHLSMIARNSPRLPLPFFASCPQLPTARTNGLAEAVRQEIERKPNEPPNYGAVNPDELQVMPHLLLKL